jgi:hypothetical protein
MEVRDRLPVRRSPLRSLTRQLSAARMAWHEFWFDPADAILIGVLRLLTGWMLLYNLLVWSLDLKAFFSSTGLQPLAIIQRLHESQHIFSFWLWVPDTQLWTVHLACLLIVALFFLGVFTRVTSVLSFLITISYSQRVPIANFGLDQILGMMCLYLSLAPSGAALSIDALFRRRRQRRSGVAQRASVQKFASARMAMRLIQLHLCAIYFWSGHAKLKGSS